MEDLHEFIYIVRGGRGEEVRVSAMVAAVRIERPTARKGRRRLDDHGKSPRVPRRIEENAILFDDSRLGKAK